MKFDELQKIGNDLYNPIFALEDFFPHKFRRFLEVSFRIIFVFMLAVSSVLYGYQSFLHRNDFDAFLPMIFGVTLLLFAIWIILFMLECFYYSYYGLLENPESNIFIDFELAHILNKISSKDIVAGFFASSIGKMILLRCGVDDKSFSKFLKERTLILNSENFEYKVEDNVATLPDFVAAIFDADNELAEFFMKYSIQRKDLVHICEWIMEVNVAHRSGEIWWSKENLGRMPGIGQSWSYGEVYGLEHYERAISYGLSRRYSIHSSYGVNELKELEAVLSRTRGTNVLLIGNDDMGSFDIISHLSQAISSGSVNQKLKYKRVIMLDTDLLVSQNGSKAQFESEFIKIIQEAIRAGNIILVIPNLPAFILSTSVFGVDLPSVFEPYLSSQDLQVIGLANKERFHHDLEKNYIISQHFENILIKDIDDFNTIKVLENEIIGMESRGMFFTYSALSAIASGAERYFPDGVMPDKAIDLLSEIVPKLKSSGKNIVTDKDILELIETKTGIPVGEVKLEEKNKLLNLEEILHKRIVGQEEAVKAISSAVRRSRSGVGNPDRPLGSFLFLGPTGVGKTETTKALADTFFGTEEDILRLDMSEYSGMDAVSKLMGSFESSQPGVLATMLREHPYGVLLLDEFEKTTPEVMNLFLQILDEGVFSDMNGKKIIAKNLIIIATSNAGSDMIWDLMKTGKDLSNIKGTIIDSIIKAGIFKPELINRFDEVIFFHPLSTENLRKIAWIMLNRLHDRLVGKGINLVVDGNLIDYVVSFGTDPKFGARPMNRAIQEKVEEMVAKKIISGSITKGSHVLLTKEELI